MVPDSGVGDLTVDTFCCPVTVEFEDAATGAVADITAGAEGDFTWEPGEPGAFDYTFDRCDTWFDPVPWCTNLVVRLCGDVAFRGPVLQTEQGRVRGFSLAVWAARRLVPAGRDWSGFTSQIWPEVWDGVNADGPVGLSPQPFTSAGTPVQIGADKGDTWRNVIDSLSGTVAWAEHGGVLYQSPIGAPTDGVTIRDDWFPPDCVHVAPLDGRRQATKVSIFYGPELDRCDTYPDTSVPDKCLQIAVEYPEVSDPAVAAEIAADILGTFSEPRTGLLDGVVALDLERVPWRQLIPTTRMAYERGGVFELGGVEVSTRGDCVTGVEAEFVQPGVAVLANRIRRAS